MYIRTKDGVYEATDCFEDGACYCMNNGGKYFIKAEILKQSENLEKLCDMFIAIGNVYGTTYHSINYTFCDDLKNEKEYESIYGAIWTSKGLIYVAEMDSEGKLVLI